MQINNKKQQKQNSDIIYFERTIYIGVPFIYISSPAIFEETNDSKKFHHKRLYYQVQKTKKISSNEKEENRDRKI